MSAPGTETIERRAQRLLWLYPPAWRERYGAEFAQLLVDDMSERPRSPTRSLDVLRGALLARAAHAGLSGGVLDPRRQLRSGLALLGLSAAAFLAAGVAIWAQLTIGWQWSAPRAPGTRTGMLVMTVTMLGFALVALAALAPLLWALARALVTGRARVLIGPLVLICLGSGVLTLGGLHFGHGWPGTGGHPWSGRDLVPGWAARFCWAATLWITSYWAHPGALSSFPTGELAWMIASPIALVTTLAGTIGALRRIELSERVLAYETRLGVAAGAVMAAFLAGAVSWVISGGPAPHALFRVGVIDGVAVCVMTVALLIACGAGRRNLGIHRRLSTGG